MTHFFITGVSKGIGAALAIACLKEGNFVTGIGRNHSLSDPNFNFITCDLSKHAAVEELEISLFKSDKIVLINNAGLIGKIQRVGDQTEDQSALVMQVNAIAPMQLMRKFLRYSSNYNFDLTIINISSGAGRRPIPSWAAYCSSKSALDMYSQTIHLEEQEKGRTTKIVSLAPGVVDTEMQETIRNSSEDDFSSISRFQLLQANNELAPANKVAEKILRLIIKNDIDHVICQLK